MSRRWLVALAALAALAIPGVTASGADFMAATSTPANTFATAADFNTVAAAITDPGGALTGNVALTATASSERGIASVLFQAQLGAGGWTDVCTATTAPWSCTWDTTSAANGAYALRAVATDAAGYTRASASVGSRVVDNTGPTVTLTDPGPHLQGVATLSATASDATSGIANVAIEYRRTGTSSWTQLCSGAAASPACGWNSTTQADGDMDWRAVASDAAGNTRSTPVLTRRVDNTAPTVTNADPGTMRGVVSIGSAADDGAGTGVASVTSQARAAGAGTWTDICIDSSAPYTCSYDTSGTPDGMYELRSTAVDRTGLVGTSGVLTRRVDNTSPTTSTLADPGTMSATATLTGTAADGGSGVASWTVQYRTAGGGTWTNGCSDTVAPWGSCAWDTTALADGLYDLRAVTTDVAGNTLASAIVASRRVDNLGPTVALTDPGAYLRATVALAATATDPVGVTSVVFERKPSSGSTWTTICTDTATPWSCSWNTATLADGLYDVRARATDTLGHVSTSTVTSRQVDNTAPAPVDVQAGNGGATAGRIEANDWIRFTWTETIKPSSVLAGWTGIPQAITVQVTNAGTLDTLQVLNAAGTTALNIAGVAADIKLNADFVSATAAWDATMSQSGTAITITLGARRSGTVKTAAAATMTWKASTAQTDLAGNAGTGAQVSETGAVDRDF